MALLAWFHRIVVATLYHQGVLTRVAKLDHPDVDVDIIVSSDAEEQLRAKACSKEPETTAWIGSFKVGSCFWDVGANVGSYSLLADALGMAVHAFEPALANAHRLLQNVTLNGAGLCVYPIALGATDGFTGLPLTSLEPGATHGLRYEGEWETHSALTLTARHLICHLKVPKPDHVKIDVDGSELDVLLGFGSTVKTGICRPKSWLVETDMDSRKPVHEVLLSWGYRFVEAFPRSEPGLANCVYEAD